MLRPPAFLQQSVLQKQHGGHNAGHYQAHSHPSTQNVGRRSPATVALRLRQGPVVELVVGAAHEDQRRKAAEEAEEQTAGALQRAVAALVQAVERVGQQTAPGSGQRLDVVSAFTGRHRHRHLLYIFAVAVAVAVARSRPSRDYLSMARC